MSVREKENAPYWRHKARRLYYGICCHRQRTTMSAVELDSYILDTLMPDLVGHDRSPSALLVYLLLWRNTRGRHVSSVQLSLTDIATGTGLSKRSVQDAIAWLVRRKLVAVERESSTAIPVYAVKRPWVRSSSSS